MAMTTEGKGVPFRVLGCRRVDSKNQMVTPKKEVYFPEKTQSQEAKNIGGTHIMASRSDNWERGSGSNPNLFFKKLQIWKSGEKAKLRGKTVAAIQSVEDLKPSGQGKGR